MSETIEVVVNGQLRRLARGTTLAQLLEQLGVPEGGTAVELSGVVVPRSQHQATRLEQGQELEVVRFVGGG